MSFSFFFIKTISNSGSGGFINNSKNIKSSNNTSIFSGLSLRIIEISGDGNNSVTNFFSEIRFSGFSHFNENHGRDFFRVELFDFSLVFNLEHRFVISTGLNFERP